MKTRNGFVSNSSSSSFVVRRYDYSKVGNPPSITKEQAKLLVKFGFKKTNTHCPSFIDNNSNWADNPDKKYFNYGYEVVCNQDEVICFLIKNKIPFIANCHYGHETYWYDPKTDKLVHATNFGAIIETYGPEALETNYQSKKAQSTYYICTGSEYIKYEN